jgi:hypothetical protein
MKRIRLRIWTNGALTATERSHTGSTTKVLEFNGRSRYHAVTIDANDWSETEFRLDKQATSADPSLFLKHTQSQSQGRIFTEWAAVSTRGVKSSGSTLIHADNSVSWTQKKQFGGLMIRARGDGLTSAREVVDDAGGLISRSTQTTEGATHGRGGGTGGQEYGGAWCHAGVGG